jgi:hypothetical protein
MDEYWYLGLGEDLLGLAAENHAGQAAAAVRCHVDATQLTCATRGF